MKVNFIIKDFIALVYKDRYIDLHNCFDFIGFQFDNISRCLKLNWTKSNGDWVKNDELRSLILHHKKVSSLKIIEREVGVLFTEDTCLADMSFAPEDDDETYSLHDIKIPKIGDKIKYIFQNQQVICIECEEIELIVEEYFD
jgi:hypothetical protein